MHDISDVAKKPDSKVPCLGCGQRDGLIAPVSGKEAVLWCMRCGTLIDTESSPIDALLPQLCVNTLVSLGQAHQQPPTHPESKPAEDSSEASPPDPGN